MSVMAIRDRRRTQRRRNATSAVLMAGALLLGVVAPASAAVWPGTTTVQTVDNVDQFNGNLSGLAYEGTGTATPGVLWGVRNGPGEMYRLVWDGTVWIPDTANGWASGKALNYGDGSGDVDAEGVAIATSDSGAMYVAAERDNDVNGTSENSVLRFDTSPAATSLDATHQWDLTSDLPATSPNAGLEGLTWVPDSYLVANGFVDEVTTLAYDPALYPDHGAGLFFVGLEATGGIYAYALDLVSGGATRIATITSGLVAIMGLEFDAELGQLWATCDSNCSGAMSVLEVDVAGAFAVTASYDRPAGLPDVNNEGFAIAPLVECDAGVRPVIWVDDNETDGHALRQGGLNCPAVAEMCLGQVVTVNIADGDLPTENADVILGTADADLIDALGGDDVVCGEGGADVIDGGSGADVIDGGSGADVLRGGSEDDTISGGPDGDQLYGEAGNDDLSGGDHADFIDGGPGIDSFDGGDGDDWLAGAAEGETMNGGAGSDIILGLDGDDVLIGGPAVGDGNDYLLGGLGVDSFDGGDGDDYLDGGAEGETMNGGLGNDIIIGLDGDDVLIGGPAVGDGNDYLLGGLGVDSFDGGDGDDYLDGGAEGETMNGGLGNDIIIGLDGDDVLIGGPAVGDGNDYLLGGLGVDSFDGGDGDDYLDGGAEGETMNGGLGNDIIIGQGGNDTLNGDAGDDFLHGGAGADSLSGGADLGDTCIDPENTTFDVTCEFVGA